MRRGKAVFTPPQGTLTPRWVYVASGVVYCHRARCRRLPPGRQGRQRIPFAELNGSLAFCPECFPKQPPPVGEGEVVVYCDGSYSVQSRHGRWAAVVLEELSPPRGDGTVRPISGDVPQGANTARMEVEAAIQGLLLAADSELLHPPVQPAIRLYSDSLYLVGTMRGDYDTRSHPDLFGRLRGVVEALPVEVRWYHVRGHRGVHWNEVCDRLASAKPLWEGWERGRRVVT